MAQRLLWTTRVCNVLNLRFLRRGVNYLFVFSSDG